MATVNDLLKCMMFEGFFDGLPKELAENHIKYIVNHAEMYDYIPVLDIVGDRKVVCKKKIYISEVKNKYKLLPYVSKYHKVISSIGLPKDKIDKMVSDAVSEYNSNHISVSYAK